jgi:hypothetical protein
LADDDRRRDCGCTESTIAGLVGLGLYIAALWQGWLAPPAGPLFALFAGLGVLIVSGLIGKAVGLALARRRRAAAGSQII